MGRLIPEDTGGLSDSDGLISVITAAFRTAWRRRVPFVCWILLCVTGAALYAYTMAPMFTATASLLLEARRPVLTSLLQDQSPVTMLDVAQAESQLQVLHSERLLTRVFDELKLNGTEELQPRASGLKALFHSLFIGSSLMSYDRPADEIREASFLNFVGRIGVRRVGQSYVVEVSYTSSDAALARRVANATVSAYLAQSLAFKADAARNGAELLLQRVNALSAQAYSASAAVTAGSIPDNPTPDADARIIGAALQPMSQSGPRASLIVAFGAALGVLSGAIFISVANSIDHSVKTEDDIFRLTGLRCVAAIPEVRSHTRSRRRSAGELCGFVASEPEGRFGLAIRSLRISLISSPEWRRESGRILAIVGVSANSGCSIICKNLCHVLSMGGGGRSATLIDADIHRVAGGLTDTDSSYLSSLADVLSGSSLGENIFNDMGRYRFIASRSQKVSKTIGYDIASDGFKELVEFARDRGDVLIDLPPLQSDAESAAAATTAHVVYIVAVAWRTTGDELLRSARVLEGAGVKVAGVILSRVR